MVPTLVISNDTSFLDSCLGSFQPLRVCWQNPWVGPCGLLERSCETDVCGLIGWLGTTSHTRNRPAFREKLLSSLEELTHRGPDQSGFLFQDKVFLGMRRLAIVHEEAPPPPYNFDNTYVTFNGEIYNFESLRDNLIERGNSFLTRTDTEVVLKAYQEWGEDFVRYLEGMFAIVILDLKANILAMYRDRFGEKPLYYLTTEEGFFFASESKVLQKFLPEKEIDSDSINHYLQLRFMPPSKGAFKGIRKLLPGKKVKIDVDTLEMRESSYYGFQSSSTTKSRMTKEQKESRFTQLFEEIVHQCISTCDAPPALLMSSGIDSAAIALAIKAKSDYRIPTYTIGYPEDTNDETSRAREIAEHLDFPHQRLEISPRDFWNNLERVVRNLDEPISDLANVPYLILVEAVSKQHKVALSGEGADEVFLGYDFNALNLKAQLYDLLKVLMRPNERLSSRHEDEKHRVRTSAFFDTKKPFISKVFSQAEIDDFFVFSGLKRDFIDDYYAESDINSVRELQGLYRRTWLVSDLLERADRLSMSQGLEVRNPFLNHRLVEFVDGLDTKDLIQLGFHSVGTKKILRSYVKRSLPKHIWSQRKRGFAVPSALWMNYEDGERVRQVLLKPDALINHFVVKAYVESLIKHSNESPANQSKVWNLIFLEMWLQVNV
jgi:asparagine synthase (glutamine-hydrolysing)